MKFRLYILVLGLLITSCDSYSRKLKGTTYSVGWVNMPELTNLYYNYSEKSGVSVVENRVTDVFWNESYILAKRCEIHNDSLIGFYIVEILPLVKKGIPWKVTGPLSLETYEMKKKELKLSENEMRHINIFD